MLPLLFSLTCSYKRFIPEELNRTIKQRNILTRMRINNVFKNFLNEFNCKTIQDSNISLYDLKVKYLSTLETLTRGLGCEMLEPRTLRLSGENESALLSPSPGDDGQGYEVQVCGTTGISWRKKRLEVSDHHSVPDLFIFHSLPTPLAQCKGAYSFTINIMHFSHSPWPIKCLSKAV